MPLQTRLVDTSGSNTSQPKPFQCQVCNKRYSRQENLKRHLGLHESSAQRGAFVCQYCHTSFSRPDLRRRHVNRSHPQQAKAARESEASTGSLNASSDAGEEQGEVAHGTMAPPPGIPSVVADPTGGLYTLSTQGPVTDPLFRVGNLADSVLNASWLPNLSNGISNDTDLIAQLFGQAQSTEALSQSDLNSPTHSMSNIWSPSISLVDQGIALFFAYVSPILPFIHQPTFEPNSCPPHLLCAMLCVALQYASTNCADNAKRCYKAAKDAVEDITRHMSVITFDIEVLQSYLFLEVYAILFAGDVDTWSGLRAHNKCIEMARRGGLMEPKKRKEGHAENLQSLWRQFVLDEARKRTLLALFHLDATWYHILSVPRSLSHLEIKTDMPCSNKLWESVTADVWAHQRLVSPSPSPSLQYTASVRMAVSPVPDVSILNLEPYCALHITLFLLSSIRELSGWATMTGTLSTDRFEALQRGLSVLEPIVCTDSPRSSQAMVAEATWRMATVELLMWSPSHTSGVVEGSLDGALAAATHLGTTQRLLVYPDLAEALTPHISWFLRYLSHSEDLGEPPWVTMFAFKAFMIAWQLSKAGSRGALEASTGDADSAIQWAKLVFGRRAKWEVGRLVMRSLEALEAVDRA